MRQSDEGFLIGNCQECGHLVYERELKVFYCSLSGQDVDVKKDIPENCTLKKS